MITVGTPIVTAWRSARMLRAAGQPRVYVEPRDEIVHVAYWMEQAAADRVLAVQSDYTAVGSVRRIVHTHAGDLVMHGLLVRLITEAR